MPVTRSRAKRLAEQPSPATATTTPARSSKHPQQLLSKTPLAASSPFSMTAASPVALKIRRQILGSIHGTTEKSKVDYPIDQTPKKEHDNFVLGQTVAPSPAPPPPKTARRARYEQAKRRFGDRLGLPVSSVKKSPSLTKSQEATKNGSATDENVIATINTTCSPPATMAFMKRQVPLSKTLAESAESQAETTPLPAASLPQPQIIMSDTRLAPLQPTKASLQKTPRKSEVLSVKLAKRVLSRTSSLPQPKVVTKTIIPKERSPPPSPTLPQHTQAKAIQKRNAAVSKPTVQRKKQSPLSIQTTKSPVNTNAMILEASDQGASTRRNLDKRTVRVRHAQQFAQDIDQFDWNSISTNNIVTPKVSTNQQNQAIRVIVRKRPLFAHEKAASEFDIVRIKDEHTVCIFDTKLQADMKTRVVQPVTFSCNRAYDESATSQQVYDESVKPLVQATLAHGKAATILMFGQTGSGKSFTCSAMEEFVARDIFASNKQMTVEIKCFEITKKCTDLLGNGQDVKLMDSSSSIQFRGATSVTVQSAKEFQNVLQKAKDARATHSTDKNSVSSRSHAVFQITIRNGNAKNRDGVLTLVDCAGTERRNDSMHHNKERQAESAEINASLYALKQCIRAKMTSPKSKSMTPPHIPFRASNLTRSLRDCLEQPDAQLLVIATLAPTSTDTEHSIETLRTVTDLMGASGPAEIESIAKAKPPCEEPMRKLSTSPRTANNIAPKNWTHDQLVEFLNAKRLLSPKTTVPVTIGGKEIMRMAKPQLRNAFFAQDDADCAPKVDALFQCLRAETDRVARLEFKRRCAQAKAAGNGSTGS